ncbi:MAG: hypothetical protein IPO91_03315 [Chloroflexi bacterium]|nr:hypothetical protein [Chloroflexota bacterium]
MVDDPPTEYVTPDDRSLRQFVREVSEVLAKREEDTDYLLPIIMDGLTNYLSILAQLQVKYLNAARTSSVEKRSS